MAINKKKAWLLFILFALIILVLLLLSYKHIDWNKEKSKIDDLEIYSQWSDEFGFMASIDEENKLAYITAFFPVKDAFGEKYIHWEDSDHKQIKEELDETYFSSVYEAVEIVMLTPEFFLQNGYIEPIDYRGNLYSASLRSYIWKSKYLVLYHNNYSGAYNADIYNLYTGLEFDYTIATLHNVPEKVKKSMRMFEPVYFATDDGMIFCIYKYYNSIFCAKLN